MAVKNAEVGQSCRALFPACHDSCILNTDEEHSRIREARGTFFSWLISWNKFIGFWSPAICHKSNKKSRSVRLCCPKRTLGRYKTRKIHRRRWNCPKKKFWYRSHFKFFSSFKMPEKKSKITKSMTKLEEGQCTSYDLPSELWERFCTGLAFPLEYFIH